MSDTKARVSIERGVDPLANRLLRGLSDSELQRIRPALEPVHLPRPTELEAANEEVRFVYFPTSGVASIVALDEGGESVDTAMIGREGMTGLAVFLGGAMRRLLATSRRGWAVTGLVGATCVMARARGQ